MFDDLHSQENKPQPSSAVAQDIFSDADPVKDKHILKPSPFQPKAVPTAPPVASNIGQPMAAAPGVYTEDDGGNGKKFFVLGLTILVMGGVIFGLFSAFGRFGNPFEKKQAVIVEEQPVVPASFDNKQEQNNIPPVQNDDVQVPIAEQPQTPAVPQTPVVKDSDQDGLTDDEETDVYFTNPNLTDTDEDGLFDREEIKVYKTNPLIKDTDLDGYSDGAEVKGGYNPNGAGKLYDITKP